ncbi:MAG: exo-beta-N-acetylmuramidase NamZ family protein, partial [Actinomycetota bacterium]
MVQSGLDKAVAWLGGGRVRGEEREVAELIRKARLGLVTNPSAVTRDLVSAPDALRAAGARVVALFGPEHGVRGEIPDGVKVPHGTDARTGIPLWSLYGADFAPTPEMLKDLDALVFDIQDVGARFYTFTSTLSHVMKSAAAANLPVIVLDRPNPIGGRLIEGPILEPKHASFVGLHPIPIRHGATMGELGRLWHHFGVGRPPHVVTCSGWLRAQRWGETGRSWIAPSPNIPAPEIALVYPGTCLLEGTNVSEARGTTLPFLCFGAPWVDAEALADRLNAAQLPGCRFRAV